MPANADAEALLRLLTDAIPHREVYRGNETSRWYVTHSGGEFTGAAVMRLVAEGKIVKSYSNTADSYHVGRTWDVDRTLEARKCLGKQAPDYYVGDP